MTQEIAAPEHELGIFMDIPEKEYHASPGISKHGLDLIAKSGAHYSQHKTEETKALIYGGAFHALVLEPYKFDEGYIVNTEYDSFRKKAAQEWRAEMERFGKRVISEDDYDHMRRMRDAVRKHETASKILDPDSGAAEVSAYWIDDETQQLCRCRPDFINHERRIVADLKTTVCAEAKAFAKQCHDYRYHVQDAFYTEGLIANAIVVDAFVFVAIEKTPPYAIGVYALRVESRERGEQLFRRDLRTYDVYKKSENWPGYPTEIRELSLPKYSFYDYED